MKQFASFSLVAVAAALSHNKVDSIPQKPLNEDVCPSGFLLHEDSCHDASTFSHNSSSATTQEHPVLPSQRTKALPWTFWPQCFSSENMTEPYCVFTDQSFAGGRGISLVTTATDAYQMLTKPAWTDPEVLEDINDHSNPPYIVHEFPGKGRGLIANKTLHRGDEIFSSTPLIINNPSAYDLAESERLQLVHTAIKQLPKKTQDLFWGLLDHFKGDPVDDRINTNAFELYLFGNLRHGVFPEIAMLNHDCRPNAAYFFDEETLTHYVHATQDIFPGEEITITYINNAEVRSKRMANLKMNWGFDCSCSTCSAHPALTAESDDRLKQIETLETDLDDWSSDSEATPEMAETLISLLIQERMYGSLGSAYRLAAMAYSSFGDKWNAIRYARLSVEYLALDDGFRNKDVYSMKQLATKPEMQWSWRKRVGNKRFATGGCGHIH